MNESNGGIERTNGQKERIYDSARHALSRTAGEVKRIDREMIEFVREKPLVAVAVALAAGYVLGRVFSKIG